MADGDTAAYERLKKLDMFEFYEVFDLWMEENKKKQEQIKTKKNAGK
jgi:hypothetical protein